MTSGSKKFIRARISRAKFRQLLKLFSLDLTAVQITALTALNRNTVNRYLTLIRQAVAEHCERESPFSGDIDWMNLTSVRAVCVVSADVEHEARPSSSEFISATAESTRRSSRTAKRPIFRPLFGAKLNFRQRCIQTAFVLRTASFTWATRSTIASIMTETSLSEAQLISTALKASGVWLRLGSSSSKG
jgi:hypothetical protein